MSTGVAAPDEVLVGAEREVRGLARGSGLNLVGALTSQMALLAITFIVAGVLGRSAVGRYAQSYAFLSLLGLLALSGLRAGLTRFVASYLAVHDHVSVRAVIRAGLAATVGGAVVLAAGLYLAAPWIAETMLSDHAMIFPLRAVAIALPAATFTEAALSATQGYRTMVPYAVVGLMFEPSVRLLLSGAAVAFGAGLPGVMVALVVSSYAAAALAARSLTRLVGSPRAGAHEYHRHRSPGTSPHDDQRPRSQPWMTREVRDLFGFSSVSWVASLASTGLIWADTILLGILTDSSTVGVYNVATRLVTLASFVMSPVNAAFGPRIADLHRRDALASLARTYAVATGWILRLSLPAFVVLLVFSHEMLGLVGAAYAAGATATVILAAGKLVDAGTGPCGLMLIMTGRPVVNMVDNVCVLALNIGLNLWLIPAYGLVGAAVAWAASLAAVNAARVMQVWRSMHMLPLDVAGVRGMISGVIALQTALIIHQSMSGHIELLIGVVAVPVVYVAAVLALGLSDDDRMAGRDLLGRVRRARRSFSLGGRP